MWCDRYPSCGCGTQSGPHACEEEPRVNTVVGTVASQLRQLSEEIRKLAERSPVYSVAGPITSHCADHLELLAGWHESIMREQCRP
jgi:hypothetical protein